MKTKHLDIRFEVKSLQEDGSFEGLLSPYGNVDQGGDTVDPGAFTKSLQTLGDTVPMLWQHLSECPIGTLTLSDRADGLYCKGQFILTQDANGNYLVPKAAEAYTLLKAKIIKGLSIGYQTVKAQTLNSVRHLKELNLFEGSLVTFPMNLNAGVSSVKRQEHKGDFADALSDNQLRSQAYQMLQSLSDALSPLPWSGASREDILSAAQESLDEFTASYMAYLPVYLDYLQREFGLDTKQWSAGREVKEGRRISSDTRKSLSDAQMHVKAAFDGLDGLLAEESDDPDDPDGDDTGMKSHTELLNSMFGSLR